MGSILSKPLLMCLMLSLSKTNAHASGSNNTLHRASREDCTVHGDPTHGSGADMIKMLENCLKVLTLLHQDTETGFQKSKETNDEYSHHLIEVSNFLRKMKTGEDLLNAMTEDNDEIFLKFNDKVDSMYRTV